MQRALVSCLAFAFPLVTLAGDIANFGVSKRGVYLQTGDGAVQPDVFDVNFRVSFWTEGAYEAGTVQSPAFPAVTLWAYDTYGLFAWDGYYFSEAAMEAAYPASELTFSLSGGFLPEESVVIEMPPSLFCANKPQFLGDTASRLLAIDPALEFEGVIEPCTVEGNATLTYGTFFIVDLSDGHSAWYQSFAPGEGAITIPAGAILPGRAYIAVLTNENRAQTPNAGFGGAIAEMIYTQETRMFFNTRGSCPADLNGDGLVEDSDFSIFVQAYNILQCTGEGMPTACPADLTNDGVVVDDDFSVFVVAYDELLCP